MEHKYEMVNLLLQKTILEVVENQIRGNITTRLH